MQNSKPLDKNYFLKYITIIVFSILLCSCNTNYIKIITEDNYNKVEGKETELKKPQINIDELLIEKEPIKLANLTPINKIAILLPMTGKYSKIGRAIYDGIDIELNTLLAENKPEIVIYDTGDNDINIIVETPLIFENYS